MVTEQDVLAYWEREKIFQRSVAERPATRAYTFYDGPPFATGLPHYGHIVASTLKDVVPRFWTMRGYRVERQWGWDCHGLPIENIVEKQFDLKSRKDIEDYGVGAFNNRCEEQVLKYVADWRTTITRLGRWVDMDNAYHTMDLPFMESIWWVFGELWKKGLIYEGRKPMHVCPRCETTLSNFEVAQGYADVTDISATASFELTSGPHAGAKILAWTTTPWTFPGNVLLAVGADIPYVKVEEGGQLYIVAEARVEKVFAGKEYLKMGEVFTGSTLHGATYNPLFPMFKDHANAFRVVTADFVTTEDGTGIVHIAPGFGADDAALGQAENVEPVTHVQMNGCFVPVVAQALEAEGYMVSGVPVKAKGEYSAVDVQVIRYLAHHGKLFSKEKFTHNYPHCWRCDTPLLNYGTSSWFVKVSTMVDDLVASNKQISWVPDTMGQGRFGKWLEGARDWAISRSRFWGTPLPVWKAEDGEVLVIGSREELEKYVGHTVDNLHKHVVDNLVFQKDGKTFRRIPEVLDCWFESGSMPYAQLHYPFENADLFAKRFPAQFIAEGQDQTRGWFYTLHVLSQALFGKPAFENVIVNGIVLAEDGKKMSKRLNNYPDPLAVMEKYGADAVRFYLMSSPVVEAENLRFSEAGVKEVQQKYLAITKNCLAFYELYREHDDGRTPSGAHPLDAWMIARLNDTLAEVTARFEAYELAPAARALQVLVTDLSTWYVRRSRDRMKTPGEDRAEALATLRTALETIAKMTAPFTPFLAETVYQGLAGGFAGGAIRPSVHLELWPEPLKEAGEWSAVREDMGTVRALVSRALEARESAGLPIKQALASAALTLPAGELADAYQAIFREEINVRSSQVSAGVLGVELDFTLTPELLRDGMAREITRRFNQLRKEVGLTLDHRIRAFVSSDSQEIMTMMSEHQATLLADILASELTFGPPATPAEHSVHFRVLEQEVTIGFSLEG
jgi:isoleucyl-tRNA synthetase